MTWKLKTAYLVIRPYDDIYPGRQPSVAVVLALSPYCLQLSPRRLSRQSQFVDVEAIHVIVERDTVISIAVQAWHHDTATTEHIVTSGNTVQYIVT